jgi:DNA replication protein DnaC
MKKEPKPASSFIERVIAAMESQRARTLERLETLPKTQLCGKCGHDTLLDESSLYHQDGTEATPVYVCPACTEAKRKEKRLEKLHRIGIPFDVCTATIANFQLDRPNIKTGEGFNSPAKFLEFVEMHRRGEIRNLILAGTPGIGKGHLAAALAIEAIDAGKRVSWIECARLFASYHAAYATQSTQRVVEPLVSADLIVLDEICLRKLPEDGEEILFTVLDGRHKAKRQTVLLGNRTAKETRAWLGERIRDRLNSGGLRFAFGEWDSMRGNDADGAF